MFDQLFDLVPDAMLLVDGGGRIVLANTRADRLFGYVDGGLHGLCVEVLMPESLRARHRVHRAEYMARPRVRPMGAPDQALVGRRPDGSEFPVEIALSPIRTEKGLCYLASIRDISETQRARQALTRARFDALVAQIGQMALATPEEETVLARLPPELVAALGVDAVVIVAAHPERGQIEVRAACGLDECLMREPPWSLSSDNPFGRVLATGRPVIVDDFATAVDPRPCPPLVASGFQSSTLVPMFDRTRVMGALIALSRQPRRFDHDAMHCVRMIANLLAALIQRRHTEEQLAHAQRLDAIGQLTGGIAHDFNNMLTVVSGNLQLLELETADNPAAKELIDNALRAVVHGAELTGKLLAFARRQRLDPRPIAPEPLLRDLGVLLRRTLGELVSIEIDCAPTAPVHADPAQLEAALINLALNSRDAMPRGGQLRITVCECEIGSDAEQLQLQPGRYAAFVVADTGHGMAPEVLAHAFEPFFTTKDPGKGNGLGLSMVYGFVLQSGGQLRADSRLGYGTRIELFLPLAKGADAEVTVRPVTAPGGGHEVLLVVEDDPHVRGIAVAFLRSLGYSVQAVATAAEALQRLAEDDSIGLLFSDVVLGSGMNGAELGHAARELHPTLPVLLASGYEHSALMEGADGVRSFELLRKPYRRESLAAAVRRQLDG